MKNCIKSLIAVAFVVGFSIPSVLHAAKPLATNYVGGNRCVSTGSTWEGRQRIYGYVQTNCRLPVAVVIQGVRLQKRGDTRVNATRVGVARGYERASSLTFQTCRRTEYAVNWGIRHEHAMSDAHANGRLFYIRRFGDALTELDFHDCHIGGDSI